MNCNALFLQLKKPSFSLKKNLFPHFHKTSFVDILQTILSNKVPIFSSCGVTLYICRKKEQEKQKSCVRKRKNDHISERTKKVFPPLPYFLHWKFLSRFDCKTKLGLRNQASSETARHKES